MSTRLAVARRAHHASTDEPRFRSLLRTSDWLQLPAPVRRRFSVKLEHAQSLVYAGEVAHTRMTTAGRVFGCLGRLFLRLGRWRLPLPDLLMPGCIEVAHREERDGRFSFTLTVRHPLFGEMIRQVAFFTDPPPLASPA